MSQAKQGDNCPLTLEMVSGEIITRKEFRARWDAVSTDNYYFETPPDTQIYRCQCGQLKHRCICDD